MAKKTCLLTVLVLFAFTSLFTFSSCKSCKKNSESQVTHTDTTATPSPVQSINLPHADTSLIPELAKILDDAFEASSKKDYAKLATAIVYRGPVEKRYGRDVFSTKNSYEKNVIRITADVFNKWNKNVDSRDYTRIFSLDQPDGASVPVLEVIFVSPKSVDRKFFIFLKIEETYKIADVTSAL